MFGIVSVMDIIPPSATMMTGVYLMRGGMILRQIRLWQQIGNEFELDHTIFI